MRLRIQDPFISTYKYCVHMQSDLLRSKMDLRIAKMPTNPLQDILTPAITDFQLGQRIAVAQALPKIVDQAIEYLKSLAPNRDLCQR